MGNLKREGLTHPKLYRLCDILRCRRPTAIGYLELLWAFASMYAHTGDLTPFVTKQLEGAMDWRGKRGELLEALIQAGFLDVQNPESSNWGGRTEGEGANRGGRTEGEGANRGGRTERVGLIIHDWLDHCPYYVTKRNHRDTAKMTRHSPDSDQQKLDTVQNCPPSRARVSPTTATTSLTQPNQQQQQKEQADVAAGNGNGNHYPLVLAEIRKHDPAVDERFAQKLMAATVRACQNNPNFPPAMLEHITDKNVARCVTESYRTGPKNHGTGLLLSRVPKIVCTWSQN